MNCNTTHYRANSSSVPGDPTELREFFCQVLAPPELAELVWGFAQEFRISGCGDLGDFTEKISERRFLRLTAFEAACRAEDEIRQKVDGGRGEYNVEVRAPDQVYEGGYFGNHLAANSLLALSDTSPLKLTCCCFNMAIEATTEELQEIITSAPIELALYPTEWLDPRVRVYSWYSLDPDEQYPWHICAFVEGDAGFVCQLYP